MTGPRPGLPAATTDADAYAGATMVEYEYRELTFHRDQSRGEVRQALTEHAEYGRWELFRVRLFWGGVRKVVLRRKIIRVRRTA